MNNVEPGQVRLGRAIAAANRRRSRTAKGQVVRFDGEDCSGADYPAEAHLPNGSFRATNFSRCQLRRALFQGSDLSAATLEDADLSGANFESAQLVNANLRGACLRGATFESARLEGANLGDADLRDARFGGADVSRASFRSADLSAADFRGVSGLRAAQLAGADLGGAFLPAAVAGFPEVDRIDETARSARKLFVMLLLACAYSWLTIAATTDPKLLAKSASSPLPVIATTIPVVWFYAAAPLVLLGLYVYFHLHLHRLWEGLGTLPAVFPDGRTLSRRAFPWIMCDYAWFHIRKLGFSPTPLAVAVHVIICAVTWWVVPGTVALFWIRALPRQTWLLTVVHAMELSAIVWLAMMFQRYAAAVVAGRGDQPLTGPVLRFVYTDVRSSAPRTSARLTPRKSARPTAALVRSAPDSLTKAQVASALIDADTILPRFAD